jgi:hypothetical protein
VPLVLLPVELLRCTTSHAFLSGQLGTGACPILLVTLLLCLRGTAFVAFFFCTKHAAYCKAAADTSGPGS